MPTPLTFAGVICSTNRTGSNAVLQTLRGVIPASYEIHLGKVVVPDDARIAVSLGPQNEWPPDILHRDFDLSNARIGRPVWLSRRDKIAQAISLAVAGRTGRYHYAQGYRHDLGPYDREYIDGRLRQILNHESDWSTFFEDREHLHLWYEDDVRDDPTVAGRAILDWWELDGDPVAPVEQRHGSELKREWRERYYAGE